MSLTLNQPHSAGVGLRAFYYQDILNSLPKLGFLEVHSENFFSDGGKPLYFLKKFSEHYPMSFHGVGLSLGSTDPLNNDHLKKLKALINSVNPALISEHISWGQHQGRHFNDLWPVPYIEEALTHLSQRIIEVQDYLQRQILVENISSYVQYPDADIPEWEFLTQLANMSGCGILLDVNNIYVNSQNHGFDPMSYIKEIPGTSVQEIHLAGFTPSQINNKPILIDTHNQQVCADVWTLYEATLQQMGPKPTLIEWDSDFPPFEILYGEAQKANEILARYG